MIVMGPRAKPLTSQISKAVLFLKEQQGPRKAV